jgi:hypothetical protein
MATERKQCFRDHVGMIHHVRMILELSVLEALVCSTFLMPPANSRPPHAAGGSNNQECNEELTHLQR